MQRSLLYKKRTMKLWQLILLLGNSVHHWTPATADETYRPIMEGTTLVRVEITGNPISVNLSNSNIKTIRPNALDALINVRILDLSKNRMETLPTGLFSKLNNLKELSLAGDYNIESTRNFFHGLHNLERLDLRGATITGIKSGYFAGLPKSVNIQVSSYIWDMSSAMFDDVSYTPTTIRSASQEFGLSQPRSDAPTYRICMTNGIVESVEESHVAGDCTIYKPTRYQPPPYETVDLASLNIKGFKKNWYRITNPKFKMIVFPANQITDVTPELINDLPSNIMGVALSENNIGTIKNNGIKNDNLKMLWLEYNNLTAIEDGAFDKLKLTGLYMTGNLLSSTEIIKKLPTTLEKLELGQNLITEIPTDTFSNLKELKKLDLSYNKLEQLETGVFKDLKNLEEIYFVHNKIRELKSGLFQGLTKLSKVHFTENKIEEIHPGTFQGLNLLELYLEWNQVNVIRKGAFAGTSIGKLYFGYSKISSIEKGAFDGAHITRFDIMDNLLTEFKKESFEGISGVDELLIARNPIGTIEKGSMLNFRNVTSIWLQTVPIKTFGNGMLFGLSKNNVNVNVFQTPVELIQGGLFDDV